MFSKVFFLLFFSVIASIIAKAQNLNKSIWIGKVYENGKTYNYELQITSVTGNKIKGYSISKNSNFNCTSDFIGTITNSKIEIIENSIIKTNFPKKEDLCLMSIEFNFKDKEMTGKFVSKSIANKKCGTGTVSLKLKSLTKENEDDSSGDTSFLPDKQRNILISPTVIEKKAIQSELKSSIELPDVNKINSLRKIELTNVFEVKGESVEIEIYDSGIIDGDEVTVIVNGVELIKQKKLTERPLRFKLEKSASKINVIEFYAENLGDIPPNTGLVIIKNQIFRKEFNFSSDFSKTNAMKIVFSQ